MYWKYELVFNITNVQENQIKIVWDTIHNDLAKTKESDLSSDRLKRSSVCKTDKSRTFLVEAGGWKEVLSLGRLCWEVESCSLTKIYTLTKTWKMWLRAVSETLFSSFHLWNISWNYFLVVLVCKSVTFSFSMTYTRVFHKHTAIYWC